LRCETSSIDKELEYIVSDACTAISNLIPSELSPVRKANGDVSSYMAMSALHRVRVDNGQTSNVLHQVRLGAERCMVADSDYGIGYREMNRQSQNRENRNWTDDSETEPLHHSERIKTTTSIGRILDIIGFFPTADSSQIPNCEGSRYGQSCKSRQEAPKDLRSILGQQRWALQ